MNFIAKLFWINHPRTKKPDAMLTLSVYAFLGCLFKFLFNGVKIGSIDFGTVDAVLVGSILTPTLIAYFSRKHSDNTIKEENVQNNL